MSWASEAWRKFTMVGRRARVERELEEEMQSHVALREESLRARGLAADAARHAARRRFGNLLQLREDGMDAWRWTWLEQFLQDLRFGARSLSRSPVFAAAAVLTLSLATGATTAIFSVVHGVLLRPLPFDDPERLVQMFGRNWREDSGTPDPLTGPVALADLDAFRSETSALDGLTGYDISTAHLEVAGRLERLNAVISDLSLFTVLGVRPAAGRTFSPADQPDVIVISAALWERHFSRDPGAIGRAVVLNGRPFTIVGVMSDAFQFPYSAASLLPGAVPEGRTDVWVPIELRTPPGSRPRGRVNVVARLKPGVSIDAATSRLRGVASQLEREQSNPRWRVGVRLEPLEDVVLGRVRRALWMLFGAVGLVLATACANVANLLLARMTARSREVVMRAALGADRFRLVRQFLGESLLLSALGGLAGAAIAGGGVDLLAGLYAGRIPRAHEVGLDWQAFAFLFSVCIVTAVLFGLAPALAASRVNPYEIMKESGGGATVAGKLSLLRDGLVAMEVALAFVLALGAAVLVREVIRLQLVDTGMRIENVAVLHLTPRTDAADYYEIEERVAHLPDVQGAGLIQLIPLQNWGWEGGFEIRGRQPEPGARRTGELRYVTPGYFGALGIPVLNGRSFTASDTAASPPVVLINEALARRYFPGEDPVGRELDRGRIVGVVKDVRNINLDTPAQPEIYYAAAQNLAMAPDLGMSLVVHTSGPPERTVDAVRAAVWDVNRKLAIFNVKTMEQVIGDSLWQLNLYRWLIGLFAVVALVLAAIGLYGVISYISAARTREFAIRLALGSTHGRLARLVLRRGLWLVVAGLLAGASGVLALTSWGQYPRQLDPDAATIAFVAGLLLAVSGLASLVPAIRTAAVDPVLALKSE